MNISQTYHKTLYRASWTMIIYTLAIIAWGAWVRISGSGAGCGEHWPLCHGQAVPSTNDVKTWTEVAHRYSTALFGVFVLVQLAAIRRLTPLGNPARAWIWLVIFFTATEALIGRALVKQGLVDESQELSRLIVMPLHLVNTSLLLFSQVMSAENIRWGARKRISLTRRQWSRILGLLAISALLLCSGAIAALGSHLLPSTSLSEGLMHDFSSNSHPAVRLRLFHPILGLLIPLAYWLVCSSSTQARESTPLREMQVQAAWAVVIMVAIGVLTLSLLAPTWLKLSHLTMANILVIMGSRCLFHTLRPAQHNAQQSNTFSTTPKGDRG